MTKKKKPIKKKSTKRELRSNIPSGTDVDYGLMKGSIEKKLDRILELLSEANAREAQVPTPYYTEAVPSGTGGGYTCITCGGWISSYQLHNCSGGTW